MVPSAGVQRHSDRHRRQHPGPWPPGCPRCPRCPHLWLELPRRHLLRREPDLPHLVSDWSRQRCWLKHADAWWGHAAWTAAASCWLCVDLRPFLLMLFCSPVGFTCVGGTSLVADKVPCDPNTYNGMLGLAGACTSCTGLGPTTYTNYAAAQQCDVERVDLLCEGGEWTFALPLSGAWSSIASGCAVVLLPVLALCRRSAETAAATWHLVLSLDRRTPLCLCVSCCSDDELLCLRQGLPGVQAVPCRHVARVRRLPGVHPLPAWLLLCGGCPVVPRVPPGRGKPGSLLAGSGSMGCCLVFIYLAVTLSVSALMPARHFSQCALHDYPPTCSTTLWTAWLTSSRSPASTA